MRLIDRITGFNGVAPGGVATVELPTGRRYHSITLYYKGTATLATMIADLTFIRLRVGGKMIRDILPNTQAIDNATNGRPFVVGEIHIPFSRNDRATVEGEEATSWDVSDQPSFTLEVGIAGTAVAPTLTGIAEFDFVKNDGREGRPGANIEHWQRQALIVGVGDNNVKTLPKGTIQRVHFVGPTSAPARLIVKLNNRTFIDAFRTEIVNRVAKSTPYAVQANDTPFLCDFTQQVTDALPVGPTDDYDVLVNSGDAQTIDSTTVIRKNGFI